MLTSLIAVLVLLVIGFYAGTIAVVGRAAIGEAQLSRSRRLALGLAGVSALALAYVIYGHPLGSGDPLNPPSPWVSKPAPTTEPASAVAAADTAEPATPAADPVAGETPATESPSAAPVAAPEPAASEPRSIPPSADTESDSSLSASAAALEAAMRQRRQALPALVAEPVETVPSRVLTPAMPAVAAPSSAPKAVETPAPRRQASVPATPSVAVVSPPRRASVAVRTPSSTSASLAYAPLTIVVHNRLGAAQQSERLALLIEGKRVASFEITEAAPSIVLPIHLPRPGLLHYRIEGESLQGERLSLQGEGCISATEGARFEVRRRSSDSRQVFLESVENG